VCFRFKSGNAFDVEYVIKVDLESGYQAMAEEWQGEQVARV
jgi:hypothetical protein